MGRTRRIKFTLFLMFSGGGIFFIAALLFVKPEFQSQARIMLVQGSYRPENAEELQVSNSYLTTVLADYMRGSVFLRSVERHLRSASPSIVREETIDAEQWRKMMKIDLRKEYGLIAFAVRDPDSLKAEQIVTAMVQSLKDSIAGLLENEDISIKVVDGPTKATALQNGVIALITASGMLLGLIISLMLVGFLKDKADSFLYAKPIKNSPRSSVPLGQSSKKNDGEEKKGGGELKHKLNRLINGDI